MNSEITIRSEWQQIRFVILAALGVSAFTFLAIPTIWFFTPDENQQDMTYGELFQGSALALSPFLGFLLIYVIFISFWCRMRTWNMRSGVLEIYQRNKMIRSIPLSSIENLSFHNRSLKAYWNGFEQECAIHLITKATARKATDIWLIERANKAVDSTE